MVGSPMTFPTHGLSSKTCQSKQKGNIYLTLTGNAGLSGYDLEGHTFLRVQQCLPCPSHCLGECPCPCLCTPTSRHHRMTRVPSHLLVCQLLLFPGGVPKTQISESSLSGALLHAVTQHGCSYKDTH